VTPTLRSQSYPDIPAGSQDQCGTLTLNHFAAYLVPQTKILRGTQKESHNSGRFFFSFSLPTEVDAAASAYLNRDVLGIRLPEARRKSESLEF